MLALGSALEACTGFASELDTIDVGGGNPLEMGAGSATGRAPSVPRTPCAGLHCAVAVEPAGSGDGVGGSSASLLAPSPDAGRTLAPTLAAEPDAAVPPPDAAAPAMPSCQGPGEFPALEGAGCFVWVAELENWDDAESACSAWGGRLAHVEDQSENELLAQRMLTDSWIGVIDRTGEGSFVWEDGSLLTFTNWDDGQPDDFGNRERCVVMLQRNAEWNDDRCEKRAPFFCERP